MDTIDSNRRRFAGLLGALAAAWLPGAAFAKEPVKFVVGFPAGGFVDGIARALAQAMAGPMGDEIIVDNKTGAGGRLAIRHVSDAAADGRTLLITPAAMITIYPSSYRKLEYDPAKDLVPVGRAAKFQLALVVAKQHPASTLAELRDWFKTNAGKSSFGTPGAGTGPHLAAVDLLRRFGVSGIPFAHYRGDPPQLVDIVSGVLPVGISTTAVVEKMRDRLKVIAVTGAARHPSFADVPTLKESGIDLVVEEWVGVFAPKGTSDSAVLAANRALGQALSSKGVRATFESLGVTPAPLSPAEFAQIIAEDTARWQKTVQAIGFQAD